MGIAERGLHSRKLTPAPRKRLRPCGLLLLLAAGCAVLVRTDDPALLADPGGMLVVPVAVSSPAPVVATARREIPLRPVVPGALILVRSPGNSHWLPLAERDGIALLSLAEEGYHDLTLTRPSDPLEKVRPTLRLLVDRVAPVLRVSASRRSSRRGPGEDLILGWQVVELHPHPRAVHISYRSGDGDTWQAVGAGHPGAGELRWPLPPPPLDRHRFRVAARDLAGNTVEKVFDLDEALRATTVPEPPIGSSESAEPRETVSPASPPPTEAKGEAPSRVELWRGLMAHGERLAGGSQITLPADLDRVELVAAAGTRLELLLKGSFVTLPAATGRDFRLEVRVGGESVLSPPFTLDSTPPVLELEPIETGAGFMTLTWHSHDPGDESPPRVTLFLDRGESWDEMELPPRGRRRVVLAPGPHRFRVAARDRCGNTTTVPAPDRSVEIVIPEHGPRPRNFSGETFRGGAEHFLLIDDPVKGAPEGPLQVFVVPVATGGEPIPVAESPRGRTTILVTLPPIGGEYWLELRWQGASGALQRTRGDEPFTIDADPPRLRWQPLIEAVAGESIELFLVLEDDHLGGAAPPQILRRQGELPWEEVAAEQAELESSAEVLRIRLNTALWPEGDWEVAATAVDATGNATVVPVPGPRFRVDHLAPQLAPLPPRIERVEGSPLPISVIDREEPAAAELHWQREEAAPIQRELRWTRRGDNLWEVVDLDLPPGSGTLEVRVHDAAGNEARAESRLEIQRAVVSFRVFPTRSVAPGTPLFVVFELREPHPVAAGLRLLLREDDGSIRERIELKDRRGRISLVAPSAPGQYRLALAGGTRVDGFDGEVPFVVVEEQGVAGAEANVGRVEPASAPLDLLVGCRDYERRWREGERGDDLASLRQQLARGLREALDRDPDAVAIRRASARLLLFRDGPDLDEAARVLEDGLTRPGASSGSPELLNDLAKIEVDRGDLTRAEDYLRRAIEIEDSALRRFNLGRVLMARRRPDVARQQFEAALALDPSRPRYRYDWAEAVSHLAPTEQTRAVGRVRAWLEGGRITFEEARVLEGKIRRSRGDTP